MKNYTDIEQSKKLTDILPIESADMCFNIHNNTPPLMIPYIRFNDFLNISPAPDFFIPCWSLAALLEVISYPTLSQEYDGKWSCMEFPGDEEVEGHENPVDACVEMIIELHEQKLL